MVPTQLRQTIDLLVPDGRPQHHSLELGHYGDPAVYADERARLFHPAVGPLYVGHQSLLGGPGHAAADSDDRLLLTRSEDGTVRAFANLCTHSLRPLIAVRERVAQTCVTCPYHQWSFRRDGSLIGGRDIDLTAEQRDELALVPYPVQAWQGSYFAGAAARGEDFRRDLELIEATFAAIGRSDWLDFSDWALVGTETDVYPGDWKAFMDVYGDCYHVPPYHPGLAAFADCDTLEWTFGDNVHLQVLDLSAEQGRRSEFYTRWFDGLRTYYQRRGEAMPPQSVIWSAFYPNLMIEYYNGLRVLSVLNPLGPHGYENRVRYYVPPDMERLVPGLPAAILEAYEETAAQDRVLNESRHKGVVMAAELGIELPTYHPNLSGPAPELGTVHFHRWWRSRMDRPAERPVELPGSPR
jgi:phenylpropionate dioxygenase-like ring-hydroxylating dioxygenase large terminal subunit